MVLSTRPCPLCGHAGAKSYFPYATVWRGRRFEYVRCDACGCTFADPLPTEEEFASMYSLGEYHDEHYAEFDPRAHGESIEWLAQHARDKRTMLDVGCGNGAFMAAARDEGYDVTGVELDPGARAAAATKTALPVLSLDETRASGRVFDVIHLGDVLEHLPHPLQYMRALEGLLGPSGVFYVEGPLQSHDSVVFHAARLFKLVQRAARGDQPGADPPTHLLLATMRAQRGFFLRLGYLERAFQVSETGWPYLPSARPTTLRSLARGTIGRAAILVAGATRHTAHPWGNRFRGLYSVGAGARG